jgi:hypothetical protein
MALATQSVATLLSQNIGIPEDAQELVNGAEL